MGRVVRRAAVVFCIAGFAVTAHSQELTSTDIGAVGLTGNATASGSSWTVRGSGGDIWGNADAFQFVHRPTNRSGFAVVRVGDLDASNPFAKAGLMIRASLDPQSAAAILDVKPDGTVEFMARTATAAPMQFLDGLSATPSFSPIWLRLGWTSGEITAWTSTDGAKWTLLCSTSISLPMTPEAGLAVTSHDDTALATALFDNLSIAIQTTEWTSASVGAPSLTGVTESATEQNGTWTIVGGGSDIWGDADSFRYLYRQVSGTNLQLVARIDDLQDTHPFAKAGLMIRSSLDPGAATVIVDVNPGGNVEMMARSTTSGAMTFLGGATITMPAWLQLSWSADGAAVTHVSAAISTDRVTWTPVGSSVVLSSPDGYLAGVAVTSHDVSQATAAHVDGLSLLPDGWQSDEIGFSAPVGNASVDAQATDVILTIEGTGSDIWGSADAFQFVRMPPLPDGASLTYRIVSIDNTHTFAKGGVMFRDGLGANAPSVILDAKPDGGVEFMARLCGGCETTFLGTTKVIFPAFLSLRRDGATFTASVFTEDAGDAETVGTVTVPMSTPTPGLAVTSHDPARTTTAIFDQPAN
jgi:hypothetical protein